MESTAPAPKPGLPGWAKVLIGLALFFLISILVLAGACTYFISEFQKKNTDPAVVQKIANTIVTIDDPLPDGFKWAVGLDIFSMKMAAAVHPVDSLQLILLSLPSSKTSGSLEENISSSELNPALSNATGTQSRFESKVKGSEMVANKKFLYAIGTVKNRDGFDVPSLMGFFSPNDEGRAVMLVGVQELAPKAAKSKLGEGTTSKPSSDSQTSADDLVKAYNLEATKKFLHAIKKI
jgi:hypothetical protein